MEATRLLRIKSGMDFNETGSPFIITWIGDMGKRVEDWFVVPSYC